MERSLERDGPTQEEAERRVDAQKNDSYYSENCSHVLVNDSSLEEFENKCRLFFGGMLNE
jgi:dephospho-CoA kinase